MNGQTAEEDFSSFSIIDRLQHKSWKARVSAYEELAQSFHKALQNSDFDTFEPHLKKMVTDTNAVAQEVALTAILEYVANAPHAFNTCENVIPSLVEKCFGAAKAGTRQKATEIVLLYAEVDQPDRIIEYILPGTTAKQPKVVVQTVVTIKELVRQFGIKKVNPKPILKLLPKLFGHTDKSVRAETFGLTVDIYHWLGQSIMTSLSGLKPVQLKELEEAFQKLPAGKPTPERLVRSEQVIQQQEEITLKEQQTGPDSDIEMEQEIDAYDLADPVDITLKLPRNFYELLASKKWQERREALDALLAQSKTPKIVNKDYSELILALAKRINDANVLLVGVAANCVEGIAQGLRADFGKYKHIIAPPMIEKLKERKPAILEQLANGLNAVFASVPLHELTEDVSAASKHKSPQVRSECFKLVSRRLREIKEIPGKTEIKTFGDMFRKLLSDADANAREAGAEGLGTMMKLLGEKVMLTFTDGLDDIKMNKIKEFYEKATVMAKASKKPTAQPQKKSIAPSAIKRAPPKPRVTDKEPPARINPLKRKPLTQLSGGTAPKRPALSSSKPKPAIAASPNIIKKTVKLPAASEPETIKYKFSQEDAEARATEFIPENIHKDLQASQWKLRLAAMESLCTHFEFMDESSIEPEIVIRSFSKKPSWKEMNFQVMSKMFYCIQILATRCPKFSKACATLCIPAMVEKLSDIKLKKPAGECLMVIADRISLQFVLSQAYPVLKSAKSPKVLSDSLLWIHSCLIDFGIAGLQIRDLIDLVKFALGNTNVAVRTSAVTVLGALRQYIGPEIKSFIENVNPALLTIIETEFERVSKLDPPQPTKGSCKIMNVDDRNADADARNTGASSTLENLLPRVDISRQLNKTVPECTDSNWKIRKEGLDKIQGIISSANNRIKPSLGSDFPTALIQRLNDSNKILQIQAIEITGLLTAAMGKPFEKYIKLFATPVVAVLSDNKANVRTAGIVTLDQFRKTCGMDQLISTFATGLANQSPTLRKDLLTWLNMSIPEETKAAHSDWMPMISPLFSCLQDRNADVRKAAQTFIPILVSLVGYDTVARQANELKAAQRQTVMPLIESVKGLTTNKRRISQMERHPETNTDDPTPPITASPNRTKSLKTGLPSPRRVSRISSVPEPEASPLILTNRQSQDKREIKRPIDAPRTGPVKKPSEEQLSATNSLSQLGMSSQNGKPQGLLTPQHVSRHQNTHKPEPMEDIIVNYEPKIHESNNDQYESHQIRMQQEKRQPAARNDSQKDIVITLISQITNGNSQAIINALKQLVKLITQNPNVILPHLNTLVNAIKSTYSTVDSRQPDFTRLSKYSVNVLILLFSNRELASAASQDSLYQLLQELAHRLLDQNMLASESGPQLSKAWNVAMVRVLENSNLNMVFSALFSILVSCSSSLSTRDSPTEKEIKYTELIMKCLWKLAKTIRKAIDNQQLNPDELLYEINRFLIAVPPAEWKRREHAKVPLGEMPLRTMKTLLLELVTGLSDSILEHLTLIESPEKSCVYPYIHHMLEASQKKNESLAQQQAKLKQVQSSPTPQVQQQIEYMKQANTSLLENRLSSTTSQTFRSLASSASYQSNKEDHNSTMHIDREV
ncbi:hypothetical protein G6F58_000673 [Rhizopus delemar]|nr:hypothetical protein G6F58_000673 [Rhizopus delemar]